MLPSCEAKSSRLAAKGKCEHVTSRHNFAAFVATFLLPCPLPYSLLLKKASNTDLVVILCLSPVFAISDVGPEMYLNFAQPRSARMLLSKTLMRLRAHRVSHSYSSISVIKGRAAPMGSCRHISEGLLFECYQRVSGVEINKLLPLS